MFLPSRSPPPYLIIITIFCDHCSLPCPSVCNCVPPAVRLPSELEVQVLSPASLSQAPTKTAVYRLQEMYSWRWYVACIHLWRPTQNKILSRKIHTFNICIACFGQTWPSSGRVLRTWRMPHNLLRTVYIHFVLLCLVFIILKTLFINKYYAALLCIFDI
jgi:hypothetical protein